MTKVGLLVPQFREDIEVVSIVKWFKEAGDIIELDESVLEISDFDGDWAYEVPAPVDGEIVQIVCNKNEVVEVDELLAVIEIDEEEDDEEEDEEEEEDDANYVSLEYSYAGEIDNKVTHIVEKKLGKKIRNIDKSSHFVAGWGYDEMEVEEIIIEIERVFNLDIPEENYDQLNTTNDLIKYVFERVSDEDSMEDHRNNDIEEENEDEIEESDKEDEEIPYKSFKAEVEATVKEVICDRLGMKHKANLIKEISDLKTDLHADPNDMLEIFTDLEKEFDIDIPKEKADEFDQVINIIDFIKGQKKLEEEKKLEENLSTFCEWCEISIEEGETYWQAVNEAKRAFQSSEDFGNGEIFFCSKKCLTDAEKEVNYQREGPIRDHYKQGSNDN